MDVRPYLAFQLLNEWNRAAERRRYQAEEQEYRHLKLYLKTLNPNDRRQFLEEYHEMRRTRAIEAAKRAQQDEKNCLLGMMCFFLLYIGIGLLVGLTLCYFNGISNRYFHYTTFPPSHIVVVLLGVAVFIDNLLSR